jgi:hypothetical protein
MQPHRDNVHGIFEERTSVVEMAANGELNAMVGKKYARKWASMSNSK